MDTQATMNVNEAAAALRIGRETVRVWLREGRLSGYMPGGTKTGWRIPVSEVERLAERNPHLPEGPVLPVTVVVERKDAAAIRCARCHARLARGESCDHLAFSLEVGRAPARTEQDPWH